MQYGDDPLEDSLATDMPTLRPAARPWVWATAAAAMLGAIFAAVSTHDFIQHLDRQQHSIHCSLVPGAGASFGETGCRTVLMSPYSSMFRDSLWGGIPLSLFALAVFSYLVYRAVATAILPKTSRRQTGYLWLATGLPMAMSLIYGFISTQTLDALCQVCLGIYIASAGCFLFAAIAWGKDELDTDLSSPWALWGRWFAEGVAAVGVLALLYVAFAPKDDSGISGCGVLTQKNDPKKILVPSPYMKGTDAVMVLDPLCPACRGFEKRLAASGLGDKLDMKYALFPLDASCNWMLKKSLHPGACAVSEAMLCDADQAEDVLVWAFENQEALLESAEDGDAPVRRRLTKKFPHVKGCLGKNRVKAKLRNSLRWAVSNALPVLTPQLFLADRRVCDQDTDLGLEYTLTAMLADLQKEGR